jgi:hypothetical protein
LPSSLTIVLSNTLVSSTCLPVSVCGTVRTALVLRRFSRRSSPRHFIGRSRRLGSRPLCAHGFSYGPASGTHANNQQSRSKLGPCPSIASNPGSGISTRCPSTTPFGLALGPTDLQRTSLPEETLDFRWTGFSPVLALLMLAFSLACSPPGLTLRLRPAGNAPLPLPPKGKSIASVAGLSPLTLSAQTCIRPVSCYALFKWWLLLSQHPGCLCKSTSFYT